MRISKPSVEVVLLLVNLALALNLVALHLTHDGGAVPPAAASASEAHGARAHVLVVVSSDRPTDATVARPVAEARGGAVLHVGLTGLTETTIRELSRSAPDEVVILGGPLAVTEGAAAELRRYTAGPVTRLFGEHRFDTAAAVAASQFRSPVRRVWILTGEQAAGPPPSPDRRAPGTPVLLVERDRVHPATAAALRELRPQRIEVQGGPGAASDTVLQQLQDSNSVPVARVP